MNVVLERCRYHVAHHFRRIADQAQAGGHHQHHQDHEEPPAGIHAVQAELVENLEPERTELVDVVRHRLGLLEDSTDDRRDGDDGEKTDRKPHR